MADARQDTLPSSPSKKIFSSSSSSSEPRTSRAAVERAYEGRTSRDATEAKKSSFQRTFQAIRILVNDELTALDAFLRDLPHCLAPGGRAAILAFHSGEDRRVKKAFRAGLEAGLYARVADEVAASTPEERGRNPRSSSAKLRWAVRTK